jgi:ElaB/YqjD/DUF883 family membrane-anchored ribosome-binding protein
MAQRMYTREPVSAIRPMEGNIMAASAGETRDTARKIGDDLRQSAREAGDEVREAIRDAKVQALNSADHARQSLGANYEQLKRELDVLRGQLVALGADASEEAKHRLQDGLEVLTARVDRLSHDAKDYGGRKLEDAERLVQERPLTSVLVSFGLGMLFAQFLRR